ncbi:sensor histidine kinase [Actinoplanes subtropicus]|uniref:sensor histidine kinase n=1 Tax=Actinoplanes subtropicus TaxID=543632 RepID=UPI000691062D|nr:HAMP domain-containing sensor histidine kinase [Actinoplanes subtropicus]
MDRAPGWSVRLKLTLSYAGFLMLAGTLLLGVVWVFLLRYVPDVPGSPPLDLNGHTVQGPGPPALQGPSRHDLLGAFVPRAAEVLLFLLVFGVLGGWIMAGRMLAPVTRITEATRVAGTGSLAHRVRLPGRNDELRELADAFDSMLDRLEAHVAEQRRFAANASHELRTPLSITKTLLDVVRQDPSRVTGEVIDRLYDVNARAIALTEALLMLSRADQRSFARERVDLSLVAEEAAETLLAVAEKYDTSIETSGEVAHAIGSPALLLQLTTNLVQNAIVHNLPREGSVWVTTGTLDRSVALTVENTGEELSPELISTLTEPFQRGTERIRAVHAGVGLGLAIVKAIVNAHDGTLALTPRAGGGLCVTVRLPAAPPPDLDVRRLPPGSRRRSG